MTDPHSPTLVVRDLVKEFHIGSGWWRPTGRKILRAVAGVSFEVLTGTTLGLVGESGCGKSTTARLITRLIPATAGEVRFQGRDALSLSGAGLKVLRKGVQMVFQDPFSSLNPRKRVADIVGRPLTLHFGLRGAKRRDGVLGMLEAVGLTADHMWRYPHELSGGQRQRVAIARALAPEPNLLVADEPLSALDVSVQAQILTLLLGLREQRHFSMLFISHDLRAVEYACDAVAVMYAGKIVETGPTAALFSQPLHPYTQMLLAASLGSEGEKSRITIKGEPVVPINLPPGCSFAARCPLASAECREAEPPLLGRSSGQTVACFKA